MFYSDVVTSVGAEAEGKLLIEEIRQAYLAKGSALRDTPPGLLADRVAALARSRAGKLVADDLTPVNEPELMRHSLRDGNRDSAVDDTD